MPERTGFLSRPGFWLALVLGTFSLVALAACDKDTPPPEEQCTKLGGSCSSHAGCCDGMKCLQGVCDVWVSCRPAGGRCATSGDCCGTATCRMISAGNGVCDNGGCAGRGGGCGNGVTCCGTLRCSNNICTD